MESRDVRRWGRRLGWLSLGLSALQLATPQTARRARLAGVTGAVLAITAVDVVTAVRAGRSRAVHRGPVVLTATTTIRRPRSEVYAFWRRLENLPTFMAHLDEVRVTDDRHSHWRAAAPLGRTVSWDAEVTEDVRDTRIGWRSTGGAAVRNMGMVMFRVAPDGVSTEVQVRLVYELPGGRLGAAVARYFGEEPHQQVDDDLRRLKQVLETGEVVRSEGAPSGKRARAEFPQRPAQPPRIEELVGRAAA